MITREDLENYKLLKKEIDATKKKIEYYKKKFPYAIHGKVSGSSSQYPFTPRSFTVSGGGYSSGGMSEEKLNQKIHDLVYKLSGMLKQYEEKRIEIEEFLINVDNIEAKLLFSYVFVDGLSQEETGECIGMEQSGVSKKLTKYIKLYIPEKTQHIV